jgi:hypothetical protein
MVSKKDQYYVVSAAIDECGSYELSSVSPALERFFQKKYYFRNADDMYNTMGKHGFQRVSDIQEVINKVKKRRG